MLFRNLLAMEVEESIRGNPIDAVVLLGGCDKTTPGQLMGAASVDLPTMVVSSGPMLNGKFRGRDIGSGTDVWKFSESVRAGKMSLDDFMAAESGMSRTPGTCMTMGSASTMACMMEAMGVALPYNATAPAVDARRRRIAQETGRLIVRMAHEDTRLSKVLTRDALEQTIRRLTQATAKEPSFTRSFFLSNLAKRSPPPLSISTRRIWPSLIVKEGLSWPARSLRASAG